jgi:hypothetical protein
MKQSAAKSRKTKTKPQEVYEVYETMQKKNGIQNIKHNNHEQVGLAIRNLKM